MTLVKPRHIACLQQVIVSSSSPEVQPTSKAMPPTRPDDKSQNKLQMRAGIDVCVPSPIAPDEFDPSL
jgi:hypothetical protein